MIVVRQKFRLDQACIHCRRQIRIKTTTDQAASGKITQS